MSEYIVEIPIAGSMAITVTAASEDEAKAAAWDRFNESGGDDFEIQWEALDSITEGNVCHAPLHSVDVCKMDES